MGFGNKIILILFKLSNFEFLLSQIAESINSNKYPAIEYSTAYKSIVSVCLFKLLFNIQIYFKITSWHRM